MTLAKLFSGFYPMVGLNPDLRTPDLRTPCVFLVFHRPMICEENFCVRSSLGKGFVKLLRY